MRFSSYFNGVIYGLSIRGAGVGTLGVAEDAGADARPLAFHAPFFEQGLAVRALEGLADTVYPAGAEAEGVRGVHEVAEDERAVLDSAGPARRVEDEDDRRRPIEGAGAGRPADLVVYALQLGDVRRVLDGQHDRGLPAHRRGRVGPGVEDGEQLRVVDLPGGIFSHASAREEVFQSVVHVCTSARYPQYYRPPAEESQSRPAQ